METHIYDIPQGYSKAPARVFEPQVCGVPSDDDFCLSPCGTVGGSSSSPGSIFEDLTCGCLSPENSPYEFGNELFQVSDLPVEIVDLVMDYSISPCVNSDISPNAGRTSWNSSTSSISSISNGTHEPSPCSGEEEATRALRRKLSNRDASFRYRQKLKHKSLRLQTELDEAFAAYKRAKSAYEKTEQTFDVIQRLLFNLPGLK
jgi:hypothetical protein